MAARKVSLKEQVYTKIFNDLVVERFPLDEFLTEKQFMELYGVSKAPVREALIELCNEGILRSIPRLGYQIIPVTQKDIANSTELRLLIEMNAFRKMTESFNEEMLEKIQTLNKNWMEDVITGNIDVQKRWMHNSLFHTTMCSFGGNSLAVDVIAQLIKLEWRAYANMLNTPEKQDKFFNNSEKKYHIEIEHALIERNFEKAEQLLHDDIATIGKEMFL